MLRRGLIAVTLIGSALLALLTLALMARSFAASDSWTRQERFTEAAARASLSLPRREGDEQRVTGYYLISVISSRGMLRVKVWSELLVPLDGDVNLMETEPSRTYHHSGSAGGFGPGPSGPDVSGIGPAWLFARWASSRAPGGRAQQPGFIGEIEFVEVRAPLGLITVVFLAAPLWWIVRWLRRRRDVRGFDVAAPASTAP